MADDVTPPPTPPAPPVSQPVLHTAPAAIWSLVLAILSFTCGWLFTAIPAVICGHIARSKIRKSGGALGGKGIATAGLILGYIALTLGVMGIPLLVSMIQSDRERLNRLATERKKSPRTMANSRSLCLVHGRNCQGSIKVPRCKLVTKIKRCI